MNSPWISLAITAGLFAALQVWWISSLLRRQRRSRLAAPLSSSDFRAQLERMFRADP